MNTAYTYATQFATQHADEMFAIVCLIVLFKGLLDDKNRNKEVVQ